MSRAAYVFAVLCGCGASAPATRAPGHAAHGAVRVVFLDDLGSAVPDLCVRARTVFPGGQSQLLFPSRRIGCHPDSSAWFHAKAEVTLWSVPAAGSLYVDVIAPFPFQSIPEHLVFTSTTDAPSEAVLRLQRVSSPINRRR